MVAPSPNDVIPQWRGAAKTLVYALYVLIGVFLLYKALSIAFGGPVIVSSLAHFGTMPELWLCPRFMEIKVRFVASQASNLDDGNPRVAFPPGRLSSNGTWSPKGCLGFNTSGLSVLPFEKQCFTMILMYEVLMDTTPPLAKQVRFPPGLNAFYMYSTSSAVGQSPYVSGSSGPWEAGRLMKPEMPVIILRVTKTVHQELGRLHYEGFQSRDSYGFLLEGESSANGMAQKFCAGTWNVTCNENMQAIAVAVCIPPAAVADIFIRKGRPYQFAMLLGQIGGYASLVGAIFGVLFIRRNKDHPSVKEYDELTFALAHDTPRESSTSSSPSASGISGFT